MTTLKTIAIVSHVKKQAALSLAKELINWLSGRGIKVKIPQEDSEPLNVPELKFPPESFVSDLDLMVALGGDGTFLRAVRVLGGKEVPVLGVNLGKFGFLSQAEVSELYPVLTQVLQGKFDVQKRMMLDCEIFIGGKRGFRQTALNEVAVSRGAEPGLLELEVYLNEDHFYNYASDGLILATPTGSTAYSLSAGGPVASPDTRVILMTPVSPHSLFDRTIILSEKDVVRIYPRFEKEVVVSVDGLVVTKSEPFDFVKISTSQASVSMIKPLKKSFYTILKKKLKI